MVDYAKPAPPLPSRCGSLADKIIEVSSSMVEFSNIADLRDENGKIPRLNQLTVNEYLPGQGIASHTGFSEKQCLNCNLFDLFSFLYYRY